MPIYEYKCFNCLKVFEIMHGIHDPKPLCEECQTDTLEKCVSKSNFHLKGKGWYKTDYKKKEDKNDTRI